MGLGEGERIEMGERAKGNKRRRGEEEIDWRWGEKGQREREDETEIRRGEREVKKWREER